MEKGTIFDDCDIKFYKYTDELFPTAFYSYTKQYESKKKKNGETNTLFIAAEHLDMRHIDRVFKNYHGYLRYSIVRCKKSNLMLCFLIFNNFFNANEALNDIRNKNLIDHCVTFSKNYTRN